jgi:hypothetical protein
VSDQAKRERFACLLCIIVAQCLTGCAALMSRQGTDDAELIHAGATSAHLANA